MEPELSIILAIILGVLAGIVYSLRILVLLERRIGRIDVNIEKMAERIGREEVKIEKEELKIERAFAKKRPKKKVTRIIKRKRR